MAPPDWFTHLLPSMRFIVCARPPIVVRFMLLFCDAYPIKAQHAFWNPEEIQCVTVAPENSPTASLEVSRAVYRRTDQEQVIDNFCGTSHNYFAIFEVLVSLSGHNKTLAVSPVARRSTSHPDAHETDALL